MKRIANILSIYLLSHLALLLAPGYANAENVNYLKQECAELGFKIGTKDNSNCAFKLLKRARDQEIQKETVREQTAQIEAKQRELEYQQSLLRSERQKSYELQQRSVAAQEEAADAQRRQSNQYMINNAVQMMLGTGAYYKPPPKTPVTCTTFGSITTCN